MSLAFSIANLRTLLGSKIVYKGATYAASITEIGQDDPDFVPAGAGSNASNTDERRFTLTPADFSVRPVPGDVFTWDGGDFVVLTVRSLEFQGEPVSLRCTAYRSSPDSAVQNADQLAVWKRVVQPSHPA